MAFVEDAHYKLIPHVPLCGWDVALCGENNEKLLLEGNFSCNFFRGKFDEEYYFNMVERGNQRSLLGGLSATCSADYRT